VGGFFLNFKMALRDLTTENSKVEDGLNYLLWHFEVIDNSTIWPRTISTKATEGRQILVYNREETMTRFEQANFFDCRISAYPGHRKGTSVKIKQVPNFLFIDLDSKVMDLETELRQTLLNIKRQFEEDSIEPTVLWSGKGYHIYLPVNAIALEDESLFADIEVYDPSRKFIQWSEKYLTNNKADPCHSKGVSFNNCMLRVPGSINSKVDREVTIVQRWNGIKPSIKPLLYEFYIQLADTKLKEIQGIRIKKSTSKGKFYSYWRTRK
jgi:hypothetical protein